MKDESFVSKVDGTKIFVCSFPARVGPGHYHDLLADLDKETPMAHMLSWLDAHVGGAQTVSV